MKTLLITIIAFLAFTLTGKAQYIVNQTASPQSASFIISGTGMWDSGSGFNTTITSNQLKFNRPASNSFIDQAGVGGNIQFRTSIAAAQDYTAMTILSSGSVGIGTTSPLTSFDVRLASNKHIQFSSNTNGTFSNSSGIVCINDANTAYTPLGFYASNYYFGGGNIGIGTTSPDSKLTVKGKIHSSEVLIDLLIAGPDYVFKKDYNLRPLADIEAYTSKNHHLPDVPAAAEMKKNGINVGEMNMTLLKKVEELTLYMIELNKTVKEQEKEITRLKKGRK